MFLCFKRTLNVMTKNTPTNAISKFWGIGKGCSTIFTKLHLLLFNSVQIMRMIYLILAFGCYNPMITPLMFRKKAHFVPTCDVFLSLSPAARLWHSSSLNVVAWWGRTRSLHSAKATRNWSQICGTRTGWCLNFLPFGSREHPTFFPQATTHFRALATRHKWVFFNIFLGLFSFNW